MTTKLIEVNEYKECITGCPFERECAQYKTAGDFRTEDGFTPELLFKDGKLQCKTATELPLKDSNCGDFPESYDKLGRGSRVVPASETETGHIEKFYKFKELINSVHYLLEDARINSTTWTKLLADNMSQLIKLWNEQ